MSLETFKKQLKAKSTAAGAKLSEARINALADKLSKRFPEIKDEEAEHDAEIDKIYDADDFKEFSSVDDWKRAKEAKEKKEKAEKEKEKPKDEPAPKTEPTEVPEWAKGLIETVNSLKAEKSKQARTSTLKQKFEEKKVPEKFWSKMQQPEKEEEFDAFVEGIAKDYEELVPAAQDAGFTPGRSSGKTTTKPNEKEVNGLVDSLMNVIPPAETQKN